MYREQIHSRLREFFFLIFLQPNNIVVLMIPEFEHDTGYLPPGIHDASWGEFVNRFGSNAYRQGILSGLLAALQNLQSAGCTEVFIDGSFVTDKKFPGDFDAAWDPIGVDPTRLDPVLLNFDHKRAAMKAKYSGELLPATWFAAPGIRYKEFFQQDENGLQKGIVKIDLGGLP